MTRLIDRDMPSCVNNPGTGYVQSARSITFGAAFTVATWWRNEGRFAGGGVSNGVFATDGGGGLILTITGTSPMNLQSYDDSTGSFLTAGSGLGLFGWEWLGCTYNGSTITHYRNGRPTAQATGITKSILGSNHQGLRNTVAASLASGAHLIAALRAMTPAEMLEIYQCGPNSYPADLVLDWRGDDGVGATVLDRSPQANHGTVVTMGFSPRSPM